MFTSCRVGADFGYRWVCLEAAWLRLGRAFHLVWSGLFYGGVFVFIVWVRSCESVVLCRIIYGERNSHFGFVFLPVVLGGSATRPAVVRLDL